MKRPNVVLILTDDQGVWAMGCYGNREIRTPNLDRLAAGGLVMEHFFCASPVCSPARATLLTGRMPSAHGIHDWLAKQEGVEYLSGLTGYTDVLHSSGYLCALSGKWHLGASEKPQKSFSHWYAYPQGGGCYIDPPMVCGGQIRQEKGYLTDLITQDAVRFLHEAAGGAQPFYLSVHYTAPHHPWIDNHPQKYLDLYENCPFESCPQEALAPWLQAVSLTEKAHKDLRRNLQGYFAAVSAMDAGVGRILAAMDELGLRQDTLVCFLSDNGFSCGQHGFWGKGNGTWPLNMYENSIRVPAVFSQPGSIPQGRCGALLSAYDFFPTLLDYLHLPQPEANLPGQSFAGVLRGEQSAPPERPVVVFDEYGSVRMIRTENWKYIHRYPGGPHELYDLVHDSGERQNLAQDPAFSDVRQNLRGRLEAWFAQYATAANDGLREPVRGSGQKARSGLAGAGQDAFL